VRRKEMRKYDDEFKREAVRRVFDGQSVASVARELGMSENLLHNWKKTIKAVLFARSKRPAIANELVVISKQTVSCFVS